jgi:tRNA (guanine-N7-)-methyltransferase
VRAQFAGHAGFVVVEIERPSWKSLDGFEAKGLAAGRAITYLAATPR